MVKKKLNECMRENMIVGKIILEVEFVNGKFDCRFLFFLEWTQISHALAKTYHAYSILAEPKFEVVLLLSFD